MVTLEPKKNTSVYKKLGSKMVNYNHLHDNILNVKYGGHLSSVQNFKKRNISDQLKEIIVDCLDNDRLNTPLINRLDVDDKETFNKLLIVCNLSHLSSHYTSEEYKQDLNRYRVLEAESDLNDNPQIKLEMMKILKKLLHYGKINNAKYMVLLNELLN